MRGGSPANVLLVLLFDAHSFHRFVAEDDGEAVEGRHDDASCQAFGEHAKAFLVPKDLKSLPYRVQTLHLKSSTDDVQRVD